MNDESIYVPVNGSDDAEHTLEIRLLDGIAIQLLLDGKEICSGDWDGNFKVVFERALKIWE